MFWTLFVARSQVKKEAISCQIVISFTQIVILHFLPIMIIQLIHLEKKERNIPSKCEVTEIRRKLEELRQNKRLNK